MDFMRFELESLRPLLCSPLTHQERNDSICAVRELPPFVYIPASGHAERW